MRSCVMLPSLRGGTRRELFAFLPICPRTGMVLYVPIVEHDVKAGTVSYDDPETKERVTLPVTGGHCKLQWKPDWAMRWFALASARNGRQDRSTSVKLSGKICSAIGGTPRKLQLRAVLDEKGRDFEVEGQWAHHREWLRYASAGIAVACHVPRPKAAKRLHSTSFRAASTTTSSPSIWLFEAGRQAQLANPVWHIHAGRPAQGRHARHLPAVADAGVVVECGECRNAVGFLLAAIGPAPAADAPKTRCDGRLTHFELLSRLRGADQSSSAADEGERAACRISATRCRSCLRRRRRKTSRTWSTRSAAASRSCNVKKWQGPAGRAFLSTGSTCSISVLARSEKARASGSFVAVYGLAKRRRMIDGAAGRST